MLHERQALLFLRNHRIVQWLGWEGTPKTPPQYWARLPATQSDCQATHPAWP